MEGLTRCLPREVGACVQMRSRSLASVRSDPKRQQTGRETDDSGSRGYEVGRQPGCGSIPWHCTTGRQLHQLHPAPLTDTMEAQMEAETKCVKQCQKEVDASANHDAA